MSGSNRFDLHSRPMKLQHWMQRCSGVNLAEEMQSGTSEISHRDSDLCDIEMQRSTAASRVSAQRRHRHVEAVVATEAQEKRGLQ